MEEKTYVGRGMPDGSPMNIGEERIEYDVVAQYKTGSRPEGTYPTIWGARGRRDYLKSETSSTILGDVEIHEIRRRRVE